MGAMSPDPGESAGEFVYPPPHPRRPLFLGIGGIAASFCCPLLGIALGVASITQVRREGGTVAWGSVAILTSVVTATVGAILVQTHT